MAALLPRPVPDLALHEQDGEGFILHLTSGVYFSLNRSGMVAWRALSRGEDPLPALESAYPSVDAQRLRADWESLLGQLSAQGLVSAAR